MKVQRFNNFTECYSALGVILKDLIDEHLKLHNFFSICLSGGNTPIGMYNFFQKEPYKSIIPWDSIKFYFGDERCYPPTHEDSNYFAANKYLFSKLAIKKSNIYRIEAEKNDRSEAAIRYSSLMQDTLPKTQDNLPAFNLMLLGMGPDGHTASLFPGHTALNETKLVTDVESDMAKPRVPRLTLTLPIINNSDIVIFLISGKEKIQLIESFMKNPIEARKKYPAAMIKAQKNLYYFLVE